MKTLLLGAAALSLMSVSAFAADLELPAPIVRPPFTWTGCYAGGQVSGGWGQGLNDSAGIVSQITGFTSANLNVSGYCGGPDRMRLSVRVQLGNRLGRRGRWGKYSRVTRASRRRACLATAQPSARRRIFFPA